jgi:hypothetical protein
LRYLFAVAAIACCFGSVALNMRLMYDAFGISIAQEAALMQRDRSMSSSISSHSAHTHDVDDDEVDADPDVDSLNVDAFQYYLSSGDALLEDIENSDPTVPPPQCGFYKCFLRSQHHPDYGYTIGNPSMSLNTYTKDMMDETYKFVKRLEAMYGIKHYYHPAVPPQLIPPSDRLLHYLSGEMNRAHHLTSIFKASRTDDVPDAVSASDVATLMHQYNITAIPEPTRGGRKGHSPTYKTISFKDNRPYLVQVMVAMPADTFILSIRNKPSYIKKQVRRTLDWLQTLTGRWQQYSGDAAAYESMATSFGKNFQKFVNQTITVLDDEPHLGDDFQVAVDPDGSIWHFDMDRAIGNNTRSKRSPQKLRRGIARIQRSLRCLEELVKESISAGPRQNQPFGREGMLKNCL